MKFTKEVVIPVASVAAFIIVAGIAVFVGLPEERPPVVTDGEAQEIIAGFVKSAVVDEDGNVLAFVTETDDVFYVILTTMSIVLYMQLISGLTL